MPFTQFTMVFFVELMNIMVILTYFEPLNIVSNFVALTIVSEFDKMMYASSGQQALKKLLYEEVCDKIMVIQHTTSKRCKENLMTDVIDEDGMPRPMRITW